MATSSQLFECPICFEELKKPKTLKCFHTFCQKCLEGIWNPNADHRGHLKCPICRRSDSSVSSKGVKGLRTIPLLVEALQVAADYKENNTAKCPKCEDVDELSKCIHCNFIICTKCKDDHYKIFRETLEKLGNENYKCDESIERVENAQNLLDNWIHKSSLMIDEIVKHIQRNGEELKEKIKRSNNRDNLQYLIEDLENKKKKSWNLHLIVSKVLEKKKVSKEQANEIMNYIAAEAEENDIFKETDNKINDIEFPTVKLNDDYKIGAFEMRKGLNEFKRMYNEIRYDTTPSPLRPSTSKRTLTDDNDIWAQPSTSKRIKTEDRGPFAQSYVYEMNGDSSIYDDELVYDDEDY